MLKQVKKPLTSLAIRSRGCDTRECLTRAAKSFNACFHIIIPREHVRNSELMNNSSKIVEIASNSP